MNAIATLILSLFVSLVSASAFADHHEGKKGHDAPMTEPSKEERTKMADMHAQAAECLKSEKTFGECHKQMVDNCKMGKDGTCPMMSHHHHGKMKHGKDKAKSKQ